MENGKRKMENGQCKMDNALWKLWIMEIMDNENYG